MSISLWKDKTIYSGVPCICVETSHEDYSFIHEFSDRKEVEKFIESLLKLCDEVWNNEDK